MNKYLGLFCFMIFAFWQCDNETSIGADVIGDSDLDVQSTSDIRISTRPIMIDSVLAFEPELSEGNIYVPSTFLLGELNDPIYGESTAEIAMNLGLLNIDTFNTFTTGNRLDSAVLTLKLDTTGYYGDPEGVLDIVVNELTEVLDDDNRKYSNLVVQRSDEVLGRTSFKYSYDSVQIVNPFNDSLIMRSPEIRIRLTDDYMRKIFNEVLNNIERNGQDYDDDQFVMNIPGLYLTAISDDDTMIGLDLGAQYSSTVNRFITNNRSNLDVFITRADTQKIVQSFNIDGVRFGKYTHNYSGSPVADYLANNANLDSLIFVQGMSGLDTEIDVTNLIELGDVILNSVQLELTLAVLPIDNIDIHPPISNLHAYTINENGRDEYLADMVVQTGIDLLLDDSVLSELFDGEIKSFVEDGMVIQKYQMNITRFAQDYLRGVNDGVFYIRPADKGQQATRSVMYGADHSQFPAKLNVIYTQDD